MTLRNSDHSLGNSKASTTMAVSLVLASFNDEWSLRVKKRKRKTIQFGYVVDLCKRGIIHSDG